MESQSVTDKQTEILLLIYRFRFLNRLQIQTMLNHEYPNRIKVWLADLTQKGILNRTYSKKFGENTKPAVYFLDKKSRDILKKETGVNTSLLKRIYREKTRSQYFREHSMFLADICLNLKSQAKEGKIEFNFFTKIDLEDHKYLPRPLPDAYIATTEGKETKRYFVEIISGQLPRFVSRKHIEYLFKYHSSGKWEQYTNHPFPTILMVCPNYASKGFLSKFITKTRDSDGAGVSFYLTTEDQIKTRGMKNDIWQKAE